MKTAISKLTQLGLSEYEARAYIALLKENPSSAYEIAKNSGIPTSKIYEVIRRLEQRELIQPIHGERSRRLFVPVSPDEFIQNFKSIIEDNLEALRAELKGVKVGMDTSYTWHIKDYDSLILKAKRMFDTAQKTVLLLIWPAEMEVLSKTILNTEARGVKIAVIHYGATNIKIRQLYRHPVEDTIYAQRGVRGLVLVADSREVLIGKIDEKNTEAIWSMNEGFVLMAEDYIRHDIYFMKIAERFDPLLRERFGERYEKLRDVYRDEEIK
jgi:sugar-specific transcriptional regulator TrmB